MLSESSASEDNIHCFVYGFIDDSDRLLNVQGEIGRYKLVGDSQRMESKLEKLYYGLPARDQHTL
ncbi:hypothetical protein TSAR_014687, partial [Trichomalopsis sarcophagae]